MVLFYHIGFAKFLSHCAQSEGRIKYMDEHQHLPDTNQLSVLAATILLAYALTPFVRIPETNLVLRLPFGVFSFQLNFGTLVSLLTTVLAAVGADWLLRGHPHPSGGSLLPHVLLPALTAWVIGVPLSTLQMGVQWWAVFAMGGGLLVLVFIAEYIVEDLQDARQGPAAAGLTALSFALYLILAIAARAAGLRLYLLLPLLVSALALICLRTLYLRAGGGWYLGWTFGIGVVAAELLVGLQYWPVSPLAYGLIVTGLVFALTSVASALEDGRAWPALLVEPGVVMGLLWSLAIALGG